MTIRAGIMDLGISKINQWRRIIMAAGTLRAGGDHNTAVVCAGRMDRGKRIGMTGRSGGLIGG